jgi:hypothetical protein
MHAPMQVVHAAVRTWVAEMKAGGPAAKAPAAAEDRPADAAARAAAAKAEAESRAQVPPLPQAPPCLLSVRLGRAQGSGARRCTPRTGARLPYA